MKKSIVSLFLALSLFLVCETYAQKSGTTALIDSITSIMQAEQIPGLFLTVVSGDSVLLNIGMGEANLDTHEKVNEQTLFRIGSISKTFTALAVLNLIEDQKLSLETPLREIAPEIPFENPWEDTNPVLIKHLLEHKAGFDDMHFNVLTARRKEGMLALEEVLTMTHSLESRWQPGLVHSYSNPGYSILGYIIEKISKMPYQTYIHQEVLQKLGMKDTHFISEDSNYPTCVYSKGYTRDQVAVENIAIVGEAAGSLLSNATDMSRMLQFFLNTEVQDSLQIISPTLVKEMQNLHGWFEEANHITEGYGLGMYDRSYGSKELAFKGHNGGIMGFVSDYIFSEALDLGIMISTNTEISNRKILDLLVNHFAVGDKKEELQTISKPVPTAWDGTYRLVNERNELFRVMNFPFRTVSIQATGDSLKVQRFLGDPIYYTAVSETAFIADGESTPSLFLGTVDGQPVIYDEDQILFATSGFGFMLLRIVLCMALIGSLLLVVVFVVRALGSFFNAKWKKSLALIFSTALPVVFFIVSAILVMSKASIADMISLAEVSGTSISIFLMTTLGPLSILVSIILGIKRHWKGFQIWQKLFYGLIWVSTVCFVLYGVSFGWFAMALWSY